LFLSPFHCLTFVLIYRFLHVEAIQQDQNKFFGFLQKKKFFFNISEKEKTILLKRLVNMST